MAQDIPMEGPRLAGWHRIFPWRGRDWPDGTGYIPMEGLPLAGWHRIFPWRGCDWPDGTGYSLEGAAIGQGAQKMSIEVL
jgi:hypothetical protein